MSVTMGFKLQTSVSKKKTVQRKDLKRSVFWDSIYTSSYVTNPPNNEQMSLGHFRV